jgi:hypothetical protein
MSEKPEKKDFSVVCISHAVWTHPDLDCTEKCLVAEIDALSTEDRPCWASNERLGASVGVSKIRADHLLMKLQKLGIVRRLGFHRVFSERVIDPAFSFRPALSKKWMELNEEEVKKGKKKRSRVVVNDNASVVVNDNAEAPGLSSTTIEGCHPRQSRVVINDKQRGNTVRGNSKRKNSKESSSRERLAVAAPATVSKTDDDDFSEKKEEEVTEEEFTAALNGDNGHLTPDQARMVNRLTDRKYSFSEAIARVRDHPDRIDRIVELFDHYRDKGKALEPGWFTNAIKEDYPLPSDFQTAEEIAKQEAEEEARYDAEQNKQRIEREAAEKLRKENEVGHTWLNDQTEEEITRIQKEIGAEYVEGEMWIERQCKDIKLINYAKQKCGLQATEVKGTSLKKTQEYLENGWSIEPSNKRAKGKRDLLKGL